MALAPYVGRVLSWWDDPVKQEETEAEKCLLRLVIRLRIRSLELRPMYTAATKDLAKTLPHVLVIDRACRDIERWQLGVPKKHFSEVIYRTICPASDTGSCQEKPESTFLDAAEEFGSSFSRPTLLRGEVISVESSTYSTTIALLEGAKFKFHSDKGSCQEKPESTFLDAAEEFGSSFSRSTRLRGEEISARLHYLTVGHSVELSNYSRAKALLEGTKFKFHSDKEKQKWFDLHCQPPELSIQHWASEAQTSEEEIKLKYLLPFECARSEFSPDKGQREWHTVDVDPGGSEVQVSGAKIVFPRGAVKKKEHFQFQINYQQSEEGPDSIRITPELSCRPSIEFLKNVLIELRTWCLSSPKIEIICNREDGTNDYEHVTIDNHDGHKVVFETSHFTRFRATKTMSNARRGAFALRCILYRKCQQYHAMFLLCDWHEMLEKASGLKEDGFHIVQMANPVAIKACDVIKISLSSAAYKVRPGKAEFTLDSDLLAKRRRVLSFEVESAPEGTIQELDCKFYVNGKGQDYYPINHMVAERGPSVGKRARCMQTASMKEDSSCDDSNGEKCSQQK